MLERITINAPTETDFIKVYKKTFIDLRKPIERQPIAISKGTYNYKQYTNDIPMLSYGNFMCIVGASKSMKTFFKTALLACYIGGNSTNYFSDIKGHNSKDKFVVDFDTEQGLYHAQKMSLRVCEMIGVKPDFYKSFTLRGLDPKIRMEFIEWVYLESELRGNIGLCAIDGVADLVDSVLDLDQSNDIIQKLMTITEQTNSAMITVIHRNFGTQKPTGHLGSAILKKAETVCFVTKTDEGIDVTAEYTRNIPFENFSFKLDDDFLPKQIENNF